jgi:hypothetical protein
MDKMPQSAGASLSDILTAIKNLVQSVGTLTQAYQTIEGITNTAAITAPQVLKASGGWVARVSVTVAGSAPGTIYDGATLMATTRPIAVIENALGVQVIKLPAAYGINVTPGTGMQVTVSWS